VTEHKNTMKCSQDWRDFTLDYYRLRSDGRQWRTQASKRRQLAEYLATFADGDGGSIMSASNESATSLSLLTVRLFFVGSTTFANCTHSRRNADSFLSTAAPFVLSHSTRSSLDTKHKPKRKPKPRFGRSTSSRSRKLKTQEVANSILKKSQTQARSRKVGPSLRHNRHLPSYRQNLTVKNLTVSERGFFSFRKRSHFTDTVEHKSDFKNTTRQRLRRENPSALRTRRLLRADNADAGRTRRRSSAECSSAGTEEEPTQEPESLRQFAVRSNYADRT